VNYEGVSGRNGHACTGASGGGGGGRKARGAQWGVAIGHFPAIAHATTHSPILGPLSRYTKSMLLRWLSSRRSRELAPAPLECKRWREAYHNEPLICN
jgi:hypothetical protein